METEYWLLGNLLLWLFIY